MTTPTAHEKPTLADFAGTIVLVGAGKMGSAMLDGWLALGLSPASVVVIEPQPTPELTALTSRGLKLNPLMKDVRDVSAIVIAVKPQVAPEVIPSLQPHLSSKPVVLSIMAGRTISFLERLLPHASPIVRAVLVSSTPPAWDTTVVAAVSTAGRG